MHDHAKPNLGHTLPLLYPLGPIIQSTLSLPLFDIFGRLAKRANLHNPAREPDVKVSFRLLRETEERGTTRFKCHRDGFEQRIRQGELERILSDEM